MPHHPIIWLLLSDKKGDNGQVHIIEEALEWPCVLKRIVVREKFIFGKPKVAATLYHIDKNASDSLQAPWPDLIITAGRRPANVALWVKQQSAGHTKIALVGKPSGRMNDFDLIIVSAENRFMPLDNVLAISLPLMRVDTDAVQQAAARQADQFSTLPRPLVGVMLGGPTGPYVFNQSVVSRLLTIANDIAAQGGTPYFTTSRRTPEWILTPLKDGLPAQAHFYDWSDKSADNPYLALLGLADGFVISGDSISMMVEVIRLGKPFSILDLPTSMLGSLDQWRRSFACWLFEPKKNTFIDPLRRLLAQLVYHSHLIRYTRDFRAFHKMLIGRGLANKSYQEFSPPTGKVPDDTKMVADRIYKLMRHSSNAR